jgi:hypothetical protein
VLLAMKKKPKGGDAGSDEEVEEARASSICSVRVQTVRQERSSENPRCVSTPLRLSRFSYRFYRTCFLPVS